MTAAGLWYSTLQVASKLYQVQDSWRNIPISLINTQKGEGKAHSCVNAC
jgi:hypothetical protein